MRGRVVPLRVAEGAVERGLDFPGRIAEGAVERGGLTGCGFGQPGAAGGALARLRYSGVLPAASTAIGALT
ncbi:hypothetical protein Stsp02_41120 [Streptomyces sp. NBRC 14336]|nr:hypothetical protein Stsp02_41120 [Streptomyces sp. NBRC 14336]